MVDIHELLEILEVCEARAGVVRWRSRFDRGTLTSSGDTESFNPLGAADYFEGTVLYDFVSGRYRGDLQMVNRWTDGAAPHIAHVQSHSFDGATYRSYKKSRHGTELPPPDGPGHGYIARDRDPVLHGMNTLVSHSFIRWFALRTGIAWMQPHAWTYSDDPVQKLSTFIRGRMTNNVPLTVEEENGLCRITTPTSDEDVAHIFCDPQRSFAVVELAQANGSPLKVWRRVRIELEQFAEAVWLPKQLVEFDTIPTATVAARCTLSEVQLNPTIDAETFEFQFPIGILVEDQLSGECYTVGPNGTHTPNRCGCAENN